MFRKFHHPPNFSPIFHRYLYLIILIHILYRFFFESERGLFPNTEFVFDLELPLDFVPQNADGEVQRFELLPAKECLEKLFSPDFKTTSAPVVVDFMIRHGFINPENGECPFFPFFYVPFQLHSWMFLSEHISYRSHFSV